MGRKTYESIGRPLPKRTNIVLTTNTQRSAPGVIISHDLDAVIEMAKKSEEEIFIIG